MEPKEQQELSEQLQEAKYADLSFEEIDGKQVLVATDESVDRDGEILALDGWKLENFKRNPVLLWSHNPFEPMIGVAENIRMRTINGKRKLTFEPRFHEKNDLSRLISELVKEGWMKTVSVGFRPFQKDGNRYTEQELLEISFVNIPANPEATTLAFSKGFTDDQVSKVFDGDIKKEEDTEENDDKEVETETEDQKALIKSLEDQVSALKTEVNELRVAFEAKSTASPQAQAVNGRSAASKKDKIRKLLQISNKALDHALQLTKEQNGTN